MRYTPEAAKALKRHANIARRIRDKLRQYADDPAAQVNNVAPLADSPYRRLRVGNFRVIFEEQGNEIVVIRIGPRGSVYE